MCIQGAKPFRALAIDVTDDETTLLRSGATSTACVLASAPVQGFSTSEYENEHNVCLVELSLRSMWSRCY